MEKLPARRTTFVVSQDGAVVPYKPPPPPARPLSREERVDAYRKGLRDAAEALRSLGFYSLYECEHSYSMAYRNFLVDFRVQRPGQVAYISSRQFSDHRGTKGRHGGTIYKLSDEIKSEFALMVNVGNRMSAPPVFVDLDVPDPAKHIVDSVIGLIKALSQSNPSLGQSMQGKHLPGEVPELPEWL